MRKNLLKKVKNFKKRVDMIRYLVYNVFKEVGKGPTKQNKQKGEIKMTNLMKKLYETAVKAGKTNETYEEFAERVDWNGRQFIGTDGGTMEEYVERQIAYYDKVISRQEEAKAYEEEAMKDLRQAETKKKMLEIIAKVAKEKNAAKFHAYKEASKEMIGRRQRAVEVVQIGLTGPVYDDDENPSYFF